jgi:pilus assembly protein Flp/PilA
MGSFGSSPDGPPAGKGDCQMLSRIYKRIRRFITKDDGPTAVEYAVMLALIIVVCLAAIQILGKNANKAFGTVGASIGATVTQS